MNVKTARELDPTEICYDGCGCVVLSCDGSCACLNRFGSNYTTVEHHGRKFNVLINIQKHIDSVLTPPILECNLMCKCGELCSNRLVQNGVVVSLFVFGCSDGRGFGLRTREDLFKGQFVCEYAGEVLSYNEAKQRTRAQCVTNKNYIIGVKEFSHSHEQLLFIDPEHIGNVGRFINHSCNPNLIMIPVRVNSEIPHLAFFARRNICKNEELTFHYGGNSYYQTETRVKAKPCLCKSSNCTGYLPFDPSLLM